MKIDLNGMTKTELLNLIENNIVGRNAERDRNLLKRRWIDGICFEPLAEEFGLSVRHVKNIVYKSKSLLLEKYTHNV